MAYTPTPDDFPMPTKTSGYVPSREDFEPEDKPKVKSSDFFSGLSKGNQYAKRFAAPDSEAKENIPSPENFKDFIKGGAQQVGNYPGKIANLAGANVPMMDFAPDNKAGNAGKIAGDVGSFFLPGKAADIGLNALSKIPAIGKGVKAANKMLEAKPFVKGTLDIAKAAGNTALYNAANHPESKVAQAENGAAYGGSAQIAINMISAKDPVVKMAGKAILGAIMGNTIGHPAYGALAANLVPELRGLVTASSDANLSKNALEGIQPQDVAKSVSANKLLDTAVTPAQASGNAVTGANEARLGSTPAAAREMQAQKESQKAREQAAIKRATDSIYKPTLSNNAKIKAAYDKANQMTVTAAHAAHINPQDIAALRDDPVLHEAWEAVGKKSSTRDLDKANFKYLAAVKRHLDREYRKFRYTDPNHAHEILETQQRYNKFLGQINPDYAAANKLARPKIVRREILDKFNKNEEDMTGKNFYNKFFNTKANTDWLMEQSKDFPQAQKYFKAMQDGWRHLSNMKTVGAAAGQAAQKTDQNRNGIMQIIDQIKKLSSAKNDIRQIKYIHDTDRWSKDINKISQITDHNEMLKQALNLFSKVGLAYGLSPNSPYQIIDHRKDLPNIH
jgi:hypothetical protein